MVEIGRKIEALERPKAAARKTSGANQHTEPSGNFPEGSTGRVRDKVAAALGVSGKTYEKAKKVVEAAEKSPQRFGDLKERMARPGANVHHRPDRGRVAGRRRWDTCPT